MPEGRAPISSVPDRDRGHRPPLLRHRPAGFRHRRGARLPPVGRPEPRGARGTRAGTADRPVRGRGAGRPPGRRRGHADGVARPAQRTDPAPRPRGGGPHRRPGPGERAATLLRETQSQVDELQARTESSAAERVVEVELLVANARAGGPGREPSGSSPTRRRKARRSSHGPRTKGAHCSNRCKRRGDGCWPTWPRAGARSGSRSSSSRAARDEMAASVHGVRDKVDGILGHLERTDEEARAAAAGRRRPVPAARSDGGSAGPGRAGRRRGGGAAGGSRARAERAGIRGRVGDRRRRRVRSRALGRRAVRAHPCRVRDGGVSARDDGGQRAGRNGDGVGRGRGWRRRRCGSRRGWRCARGRGGGSGDGGSRDRGSRGRGSRGRGSRGRTRARRPDHRAARRIAGTGHGAAQPHGQARPGRRPEPVARPAAQLDIAVAATSCWAPRKSTWSCSPAAARGSSGRGVRRRNGVRRSRGGGRTRRATRSRSRRPRWPAWS